MAFGKKLTSKGFLGSALSLISKGWLHLRGADGEVLYPPRDFCDYPHATKMATKGRVGGAVGIATRGASLRICIEETLVRTTGPGRRGFREEEIKKKIVVTVTAYGKKFRAEKIVEMDQKVKVSDLEIIDVGNKEIKIIVKDISKE